MVCRGLGATGAEAPEAEAAGAEAAETESAGAEAAEPVEPVEGAMGAEGATELAEPAAKLPAATAVATATLSGPGTPIQAAKSGYMPEAFLLVAVNAALADARLIPMISPICSKSICTNMHC